MNNNICPPQNERRETVYHAASGFYTPYTEPAWKKERRLLRSTGNGIGLATIFYLIISLVISLGWIFLVNIIYPEYFFDSSGAIAESLFWGFNIISYLVSLIVPFSIYALCIGMPFRVAVPLRKAKTDLTIGGAFVCLGVGIIAAYATTYLELFFNSIGIDVFAAQYDTPFSLPGIVLYIINTVIIAGFTEEILFRGIIMQSLRRFGDLFALVVSSFIFGAIHLNLVQMPYAFIFGLAMGYFVLRTGSLWVGIIVHIINNSLAVLFEYLTPAVSDETLIFINLLYNIVFIVLAIGGVIYLSMKYKDIFRFERSRSVLPAGKRCLYLFTAFFMIIATIVCAAFGLQYISFI